MALIEINNVTRRYTKGDETITPLDEVTLSIKQGEFVSLMGASGTGKSTLLNLIASIDRPDSGTIVIDGVDTPEQRTVLIERAMPHGFHTYIGDTDMDGEFSSDDITRVFQVGQYEDGIEKNSRWATGDWNGDQ